MTWFMALSPGNDNWYGLVGCDLNSIDWTVHPAEVTDLAIIRVADDCFLGFRVHPDHIGGTDLDAGFATDASVNRINWHSCGGLASDVSLALHVKLVFQRRINLVKTL